MLLIDTYLDKSKIHGVGVFAKENAKKGEKIKEVRPEFEMEFDQNNLPRMPLALANFIETHSFQKELGSNILIMGIDNETQTWITNEESKANVHYLRSKTKYDGPLNEPNITLGYITVSYTHLTLPTKA